MKRLLATILLLTLAGCSKPAPPPVVGQELSALDWSAAPAPAIRTAAPPEGQGPPTDLTDVAFADRERGFSVSWSGKVYRTEDGGASWQPVFALEGARFEQVATAGPLHAVAVGRTRCETNCEGPAVLVRTVDGGATWETVESPAGTDTEAPHVFPRLLLTFVTPSVGFAAPDRHENYGPYGRWVLKTTDGGRSWTKVIFPEGFGFSGGLDFLNESVGYVTGSDEVLRTRDGGATWERIYRGEGPLFSLDFVNEQIGFAGGGGVPKAETQPRRRLLATTNGGATWNEVFRAEGHGSPFTRLQFESATTGWALQGGCWSMGANGPCRGGLFRTTDGGRTWAPAGASMHRLRAVGARVWSLGEAGRSTLYRSDDGGATWTQLAQPGAVTVQRVHFLSPAVGWVESNLGWLKTVDGGATWSRAQVTQPGAVFLTEQVALAPASEGLQRSEDGGQTWQTVTAPGWVVALAAAGGHAWYSTEKGLFTSADAGKTWTELIPATGYRIDRIAFADGRRGAALAFSRALLLTEDGGRTWSAQVLPQDLSLYDVGYHGGDLWLSGNVPGKELGQVVGVLLHSADGGKRFTVWKGGVMPESLSGGGWVSGYVGDTGGALLNLRDGRWEQVWPVLSK